MSRIEDRLSGGLVVSCQPVENGPMDRTEIVVAMAHAAVDGGAAGLRIEGAARLAAVRKAVDVPIIGIVKRDLEDSPVRITVTTRDVHDLIDAGADVVACDATSRPRPQPREAIIEAILSAGVGVMADCATRADGEFALAAGAAILGTTLSGYTAETVAAGNGPDFKLIGQFKSLGAFVMAEGRFNSPKLAAMAMQAGADCVTVGSALTRLEHAVGWFDAAVKNPDEA